MDSSAPHLRGALVSFQSSHVVNVAFIEGSVGRKSIKHLDRPPAPPYEHQLQHRLSLPSFISCLEFTTPSTCLSSPLPSTTTVSSRRTAMAGDVAANKTNSSWPQPQEAQHHPRRAQHSLQAGKEYHPAPIPQRLYELTLQQIDIENPKDEEFRKINPNGRLPAIVDPNNNNLTLWESGAIAEYLVETYDKENKINATDAADKWHLKQFLHFQMSGQVNIPHPTCLVKYRPSNKSNRVLTTARVSGSTSSTPRTCLLPRSATSSRLSVSGASSTTSSRASSISSAASCKFIFRPTHETTRHSTDSFPPQDLRRPLLRPLGVCRARLPR